MYSSTLCKIRILPFIAVWAHFSSTDLFTGEQLSKPGEEGNGQSQDSRLGARDRRPKPSLFCPGWFFIRAGTLTQCFKPFPPQAFLVRAHIPPKWPLLVMRSCRQRIHRSFHQRILLQAQPRLGLVEGWMVLWVRPGTEKVRWRQSLTPPPHPRSLQVTPAVFTSLPLSSSCFFFPQREEKRPVWL